MFSVTKQFPPFSYSHCLPWGGPCGNTHGHNGVLEVEFSSKTFKEFGSKNLKDKYDNMVLDFHEIKNLVGPIAQSLDHTDLNKTLPEIFQPPTAENIVRYVLCCIMDGYGHEKWGNVNSVHVSRIRVYETPTSWAEWRRDYEKTEGE